MIWGLGLFVVVLVLAAVLNYFVASPLARVVIDFEKGQAKLRRGAVPPQRLLFVRDLLRGAGVKKASVAILPTGRLWFSPAIPESVHQQLRNVLMD